MENCSKTSTTKRMSGLENSGSCFMNRIELEEENSNVYVAITGSNSMEVKIEKSCKKVFTKSSFLGHLFWLQKYSTLNSCLKWGDFKVPSGGNFSFPGMAARKHKSWGFMLA